MPFPKGRPGRSLGRAGSAGGLLLPVHRDLVGIVVVDVMCWRLEGRGYLVMTEDFAEY